MGRKFFNKMYGKCTDTFWTFETRIVRRTDNKLKAQARVELHGCGNVESRNRDLVEIHRKTTVEVSGNLSWKLKV